MNCKFECGVHFLILQTYDIRQRILLINEPEPEGAPEWTLIFFKRYESSLLKMRSNINNLT